MIRYIKLKNYRSFTNLDFNLTGKNGRPLKLAIIYGENGSGKSNIISVFETLYESFQTMQTKDIIMRLLEENSRSEYINHLSSLNLYNDVTNIIKENKTVGSDNNMIIEIGFYLNEKQGTYLLEFDSERIVHEKLEYTLTKNKGLYFDITKDSAKINPSVFMDFKYTFEDKITKYWGKHSALSILYNAKENYTADYFNNNTSSSFQNLLNYFQSFSIYMSDNDMKYGILADNNTLSFDEFTSGEINISDNYKLDITERILNKYFTSMYRDINSVYYERITTKSSIEYELYFNRFISGKERAIHYSDESCGTKNLLYLLPYCIAATKGHTVAIDEIDDGIHDVLLINLIKSLNKDITGQAIITTHNTLLLNEYDIKDAFHFIEINDNGNRTITTPADYGYRIQKDSNVMLNYLQNRFKGLPWNDLEIDFRKIAINQ